jgi:5-formyltetrahydrofolate cyclo-ligase
MRLAPVFLPFVCAANFEAKGQLGSCQLLKNPQGRLSSSLPIRISVLHCLQIYSRYFDPDFTIPTSGIQLPQNMETHVADFSGHKNIVRQTVWPKLREVAIPDSRFHLDFDSFIADFQGSSIATERLTSHPCFTQANTVFITPDNCLQYLRYAALAAGKLVLVTTYAIRRGFVILDPRVIQSEEDRRLASYLDGMEDPSSGAAHISLTQMLHLNLKIDLMVTGTGAINLRGIRFGKGHGFFDLEWGMLSSVGMVNSSTPCVAVVHDCQVIDAVLQPELFDTVCDLIVTPTRVIEVDMSKESLVPKPSCRILWDRLQPNMLENIPCLRELEQLERLRKTSS